MRGINGMEEKRRTVRTARIIRPLRRETISGFCSGSLRTLGAGADGAEMIVGVDTCGVAIGERDLDSVVPYLRRGGGAGFWFVHGKHI